jgi:hypothetical protein
VPLVLIVAVTAGLTTRLATPADEEPKDGLLRLIVTKSVPVAEVAGVLGSLPLYSKILPLEFVLPLSGRATIALQEAFWAETEIWKAM